MSSYLQPTRPTNGRRIGAIEKAAGTSKLGAETLPQVVTRGVLLDIAKVRCVTRMEPGDVITPADAEAALTWDDDPACYPTGEPGPGVQMINWLVEHRDEPSQAPRGDRCVDRPARHRLSDTQHTLQGRDQ